jgi:site-specific DNA recombinase
MNKRFGWVIDHDKTLVCVSENLDLSTWVGRMIANVIAGVAEGELESLRERTRGSQKKLRELGRWGGGIVFYGFKPAERGDTAGWVWEHDDHSSVVLLAIIDQVLDGKSTEQIAGELNHQGELAPSDYTRQRNGKPVRGTKWTNAHQIELEELARAVQETTPSWRQTGVGHHEKTAPGATQHLGFSDRRV